MNAIDKNTVSPYNQLEEKNEIYFLGSENPSKKVLILGNSITLHGVKPQTGWYGNWGMAASCKEKDYVHILYDMVKKALPDVQFCIAQVARWEVGFFKEETLSSYMGLKDYNPDIVILRFGENVQKRLYEVYPFEENYVKFMETLLPLDTAKLIFTTSFWHHAFFDPLAEKYCKKYGGTLVRLGDLGELDEMKAIGLWEDEGIQNHPGDLGMKAIADRIYDKMRNFL